MSVLWERLFESGSGELGRWLDSSSGSQGSSLRVHRLPRPAWPLLAGTVARACLAAGRSLLVLVPAPDRFLSDLRPWLGGRPLSYLFAEVTVNFLDRPPAFDQAVALRLEALAALAGRSHDPCLVVSSRRAAMRPTVSAADLAATSVVLAPGESLDPVALAGRLVELGYSREALVELPGQFSLRGGILDVFPAASAAPARAEWFGDQVETVRLFDPSNQRSVMPVPRVTVRPGREVLLGAQRGSAAAGRLRLGAALDGLRGDVRAEWEDDLERLSEGSSFPGVELYAAYLEPGLPSLFDHVGEDVVLLDFEPARQLGDVRELEQETLMLLEAEAGDGELPRGFVAPMVPARGLEAPPGAGARLQAFASEAEGATDLGFGEPEPLVGRPLALAGLAADAASAQRTVVLASEQSVPVEVLPEHLLLAGGIRIHRGEGPLPPDASLYDIVADFERRTIIERLEQTGWSQTEAADSLHVPLSTLNQKIKRLNIEVRRKSQ